MRKVVIAAAALMAVSGQVQAAEEESVEKTDDIVVTATRSEESAKTIPAKVEVITSEDIELTTGQTLTDQLKKSSSVSVIQYPGALSGIGIRGFRPEFSGITKHSLLLLNGRPAGATNLATIMLDNVERIEVLKGPASSLYGSEAMGGVVNIITKKNTDEINGSIELGYGSFQTNTQKAEIGGGLGKGFDFDFSAGRYEQADDFKLGDNGDERPNTAYSTQNAALRIGTDIGNDWRVDINSNLYQGRDIETPGDIVYGDSRSGSKDIDNYGIDLQATGQLNDANTLGITTYATRELQESYSNHYYGTAVPTYQSYDSETTWYGAQIKDTFDFGAHTLIGGLDFQYIEKEARSYTTSSERKSPSSPDESRTNYAAYAESIWRFIDERLTFTAGGRYDAFDVETLETPYKSDFDPNSETFQTFSPRAGLNYLFDAGARLHTSIGQAFVPPDAFELAGYSESVVDGATMITTGNSDLDPETSTTWDIGAGFEKPQWGISADVTYFYTDVQDRITRVTEGYVTTYENSLGAETQGIETELSFDLGAVMDWNRSLKLYANATNIINAEEEVSAGSYQDIHNVADYTYNYGLQYNDSRFDSRLNCRTVGPMRDTDWVTAGYPEIEYPEFTVLDLVFGYSFLDHHKLTLSVDNLLDEDYYEKKGYPLAGQSFMLTYSYNFSFAK